MRAVRYQRYGPPDVLQLVDVARSAYMSALAGTSRAGGRRGRAAMPRRMEVMAAFTVVLVQFATAGRAHSAAGSITGHVVDDGTPSPSS